MLLRLEPIGPQEDRHGAMRLPGDIFGLVRPRALPTLLLATSSFLAPSSKARSPVRSVRSLLVVMPGAPSSFVFLVPMHLLVATSSFLSLRLSHCHTPLHDHRHFEDHSNHSTVRLWQSSSSTHEP